MATSVAFPSSMTRMPEPALTQAVLARLVARGLTLDLGVGAEPKGMAAPTPLHSRLNRPRSDTADSAPPSPSLSLCTPTPEASPTMPAAAASFNLVQRAPSSSSSCCKNNPADLTPACTDPPLATLALPDAASTVSLASSVSFCLAATGCGSESESDSDNEEHCQHEAGGFQASTQPLPLHRSRSDLLCAIHEGADEVVARLVARGADVNAPASASDDDDDDDGGASGAGGGGAHDDARGQLEVEAANAKEPMFRCVIAPPLSPPASWLAINQQLEATRTALDSPTSSAVVVAAASSATATTTAAPLVVAAAAGHLPTVNVLLAAGSAMDAVDASSGQTALSAACHAGHCEVVSTLLLAGARVDAGDSEGQTPLVVATAAGHWKVVCVLLAWGADVDGASCSVAPLQLAAAAGDVAIVSALLASGATANVVDSSSGASPLIQAAAAGHAAVVSTLVDALDVANVDARDNEGRTALLAAAAGGHNECVEVLAEAEADLVAVDSAGHTALDLAEDAGCCDTVAILLRAAHHRATVYQKRAEEISSRFQLEELAMELEVVEGDQLAV